MKTARKPIVVFPYMPFMRQDRMARATEPFSFKLVGELFSPDFISAIITFNLHKHQLAGFFRVPVVHISLAEWVAHIIKRYEQEGSGVLLSADQGVFKVGLEVLKYLGENIQWRVETIIKLRIHGLSVLRASLDGAKNVVIFDDILATGGTMIKAVQSVKDYDPRVRVTIAVGRGLFVDKIKASKLLQVADQVVVSDSVMPMYKGVAHESIAPLILERLASL